MDLMFGATVFEHGRKAGRLAGVEIDPASRRALKIIFSANGHLGPGASTRPVKAVAVEGDRVTIVGDPPPSPPMPFRLEPQLWSPGTHVVRGREEVARLAGVRVEQGSGKLLVAFGRRSLWSRRLELPLDDVDLSVLGEIRVGASHSTAA
jgi:hypothetical protein